MSNEPTIVTGTIETIRPIGKSAATAEGLALGTLIPEHDGAPRIAVGTIAPIKAEDVRFDRLATPLPPEAKEQINEAIGKVLGAPQFLTPPDGDDLSPMRVTLDTAARAVAIATAIAETESTSSDPGAREAWLKLQDLSRVYVRASERRVGRLYTDLTAIDVALAEAIARGIVGMVPDLAHTEGSAEVLTLAFSFLSRLNAERAIGGAS